MRRSLATLLILALSAAPAAQHLRIGIVSDPDVLDPTLSRAVAARQVFMALCDKLVHIDGQGRIVAQLATSWAWEEDGRALRLTLRPAVRFHDGASLFAEAAVAG
jgi:peptide/nickel transport system substrate-binding protein